MAAHTANSKGKNPDYWPDSAIHWGCNGMWMKEWNWFLTDIYLFDIPSTIDHWETFKWTSLGINFSALGIIGV